MLLSLDWLSSLVDLDGLDTREIADLLTLATAEVEQIEEVHLKAEGIVAEVVYDGGTLVLSDGSTTLPGSAPDALAVGARVVVLRDGKLAAPLTGGPGPWLLGADVAVGQDVEDLVPASDTLFELDNKSLTHRPDLWGHYGFARELAAIFERELVDLEEIDLSAYADLPSLPVQIESPDCFYYSAIAMRCAAADPSPLLVQRRLAVLDQRSLGLAVDLSNYVMLELAQPTHAFDGDGVAGLRTAPAGRAIEFVGVDDVSRKLAPEDLLIWSGDQPVGLAGIIGAKETGVSAATRRIALESANFAAARVRRTQIRLGLRTDAGQRFEKSQPWRMAAASAARFVHLITAADSSATVETSFSEQLGDVDPVPRRIRVAAAYFSRVAGIDISGQRAANVLRSLRFDVEDLGEAFVVTVPRFRSDRDISESHDLLEEVTRVVGYDNIPPILPQAQARPAPLGESLVRERHVRSVLSVAHRFVEMRTYHWFDGQWLEQLGYEPHGTLMLRNPTSPNLKHLRSTLTPNVLALARLNRDRPEEGRIYEIGHVYEVGESATGSNERALVAGVIWNRARSVDEEAMLRAVRGVVEDLLEIARPKAPLSWQAASRRAPWNARGATLQVSAGDELLGTLGIVATDAAAAVGRGMRLATFELDLDAIGRISPAKVQFELPTKFPGSWFDLSLQWPQSKGYRELATSLEVEEELIVRREFLGLYAEDDDLASYSFRFWVESQDRTLSSADVDGARDRLLVAASSAGARIRSRDD